MEEEMMQSVMVQPVVVAAGDGDIDCDDCAGCE